MRTLAVLPVKRFDDAKRRLEAALGRGSRRALAQAMFTDVVAALRRCREVDAIVVVTADTGAEAAARSDRVLALRDTGERGQSAAAALGVDYAVASGFDRVVMVASDTPLLEPSELDRLLDRAGAEAVAVTIVPDRHGTGTNALALCPPGAIAPAFGPDSCARHEAAARAAELSYRVAAEESLGHDVDTPEDLEALAAVLDRRRGLAPATRGALRQLDRMGATARGRAPAERPLEV